MGMGFGEFVNKGAGFMADPFGAGGTFSQAVNGGPIAPSYLGGSAEAEARERERLTGMAAYSNEAGAASYGQGMNMLGAAASNAQDDRLRAQGFAGQGQLLGQAGVSGQNAAVANARGLAGQSTDSLALLQLQQAQDQNARQMMGMAAQARGGNQAAAMRNAQAFGSQNQLVTNQQAAQLRAAEQQAALNRQLGVEQMAAGIGGQQAGLGYGMQGQGLGMAGASTNALGNIGGAQVSGGLGQQNVGLGQLGILAERDKAKLEAERANTSANAANKNPGAIGGTILGAIFGG